MQTILVQNKKEIHRKWIKIIQIDAMTSPKKSIEQKAKNSYCKNCGFEENNKPDYWSMQQKTLHYKQWMSEERFYDKKNYGVGQ